ncbi:MAG: ABC transporter permease [Armatimonadota bacterium]
MTPLRLIARSLCYYWRTGVLVLLGIAVATAVITGSLIVGNSVSGSLRKTALQRLGRIDAALVSPRFFREAVAQEIAQANPGSTIVPIALLHGAVRNAAGEATIPNITIIGVDDADFNKLYHPPHLPSLTGRQAVINDALARDLDVTDGDALLISVDRQVTQPSTSLFSHRKREKTVHTMRLQVTGILPAVGVGAFALDAGTYTPRNLFVSRTWLTAQLGKADLANAILATGSTQASLQTSFRQACTLRDFGLTLTPHPQQGYLVLHSDGIVFNDTQIHATVDAAKACHAMQMSTSMYLATTVQKVGGSSVSYALIAGSDSSDPAVKDKSMGSKSIILNEWTARDLDAHPGDRVRLSYFIPSRDGVYRTASADFTVLDITDKTGDPDLVPPFEGITTAKTITDWSPPFPIDMRRVTARDEEYWQRYRTTPKALLTLNALRSMWQHGPENAQADWVTGVYLVPDHGTDLNTLQAQFPNTLLQRLSPEEMGMVFRPVREQALAAAKGTNDFGELFLSMSFFLVLAAAGLAGMMMRLLAMRRAGEIGIMLAGGISHGTILRVIIGEGIVLTVAGVILGVPIGALYAYGIIHALASWWQGAVGTSALWVFITPSSLLIGAISGLIIGVLTVTWAAWTLRKRAPLELLSGAQAMGMLPSSKRRNITHGLFIVMLLFPLGLFLAGAHLDRQTVFFGSGASLLIAGLLGCYVGLLHSLDIRGILSLPRLALRSAAANRGRSMLVIGLLSGAAFLLVTVAANTRDYSRADVTQRDSGAGGFTLRAVSSLPIRYDFGTSTGRANLAFTPEDEKLFADVTVLSFLASPGDDISCLNISRATYPRILGVSDEMITRGGFHITTEIASPNNPWQLLKNKNKQTVPTFGDTDSVLWSLRSNLGQIYTMPGSHGKQISLRFAGLLSGSIFAGELLVDEQHFRQLYPEVDAPSYFLIATPPGKEETVAAALRRNLGDLGLDIRSTREVLNDYSRVQNTYLATFMALGGLGLLLGTLGLVVVLLRNAQERRSEFALLLATGFHQADIARLLVIENAGLLVVGICCGAISALIAIIPQITTAEARVNWMSLCTVLGGILIIGLASSVAAAWSTAGNRKLIEALREE